MKHVFYLVNVKNKTKIPPLLTTYVNNRIYNNPQCCCIRLGMVQALQITSMDSCTSKKQSKPILPQCNPTNIVSLDCEMVGCGAKGKTSALARCSIVDYLGNIIYDSYIKPMKPVTDYRTKWSGIKRIHLSNATPFPEARKLIKRHLSGKYIVGHDLKNDFHAIKFSTHPLLIKDTSTCLALRHLAGLPEKQKPSLRKLTGRYLN